MQEVGRVIRVHPGKDRALIIDPYDLFSAHGVTHAAALGEPEPTTVKVIEDEDPFPYIDLPPPEKEIPPAVAVDAVGAWSRALLRLMQTAGLYVPDPKFAKKDARWRRGRATEKQMNALGRMAVWSRYMPEEHRKSVKAICKSPNRLRAGVAADLMNVLSAVASASETHRKARRHWPWPTVLSVAPLPGRVVRALGES